MSEGACEVSIAFEGEVLVQTQMENEFTYEVEIQFYGMQKNQLSMMWY